MKTLTQNLVHGTPSNIDFGITDAKGRAIGFSHQMVEFDVVEASETGSGYCTNYNVTGHYFRASGISTRNGKAFGSADIRIEGLNQLQVATEFAARVERARKAAVKKFGAKQVASKEKDMKKWHVLGQDYWTEGAVITQKGVREALGDKCRIRQLSNGR